MINIKDLVWIEEDISGKLVWYKTKDNSKTHSNILVEINSVSKYYNVNYKYAAFFKNELQVLRKIFNSNNIFGDYQIYNFSKIENALNHIDNIVEKYVDLLIFL